MMKKTPEVPSKVKKAPGSRREGRALAVQCIYMLDHNSTALEKVLPGFMAFRLEDDELLAPVEKSRAFCESLVRGVAQHWRDLDRRIKSTIANYGFNRIGGVERAILRLGVYEMLHCLDTPPVVAINEAVELAKRFASDDAGRFVNGVLDRIRTTLTRPARTALQSDHPPAIPEPPVPEVPMENVPHQIGEFWPAPPEEYSPGRQASPEQP